MREYGCVYNYFTLTLSLWDYGIINCLSAELITFLTNNRKGDICGLLGGRLLATSMVKGLSCENTSHCVFYSNINNSNNDTVSR